MSLRRRMTSGLGIGSSEISQMQIVLVSLEVAVPFKRRSPWVGIPDTKLKESYSKSNPAVHFKPILDEQHLVFFLAEKQSPTRSQRALHS